MKVKVKFIWEIPQDEILYGGARRILVKGKWEPAKPQEQRVCSQSVVRQLDHRLLLRLINACDENGNRDPFINFQRSQFYIAHVDWNTLEVTVRKRLEKNLSSEAQEKFKKRGWKF